MDEQWLPISNAARVLHSGPGEAVGVVLALHGYGQLATVMSEALGESVAEIGWALCAPEAPHRFYVGGAGGAVGASWMSRHGREHDIAATRRYLTAVVEDCRRRWPRRPLVVLGFSQGASQAWRLAHTHAGFTAVIAVGGDIPPELHRHVAAGMPPALLLRGGADRVYDSDRQAADAEVLAAQGWPHTVETVAGSHHLGAGAVTAVAQRLQTLAAPA